VVFDLGGVLGDCFAYHCRNAVKQIFELFILSGELFDNHVFLSEQAVEAIDLFITFLVF
jgi:hypothetical protein